MPKISIAQIKIGDRFRKDFGDLNPLIESFKARGQMQPVVIDRYHNLIAGERRIKAATELGWKDIEYIFRDKVDELTARELELEENICRKNFTPEEEVKAILEIHRLKVEKYGPKLKQGQKRTGEEAPGWSLQDTAESLGISKATVTNYVTVAKYMDLMPEVKEALVKQGVTPAYKLVRHIQEIAATRVLSEQINKKIDDQINEPNADSIVTAARIVDDCLFNCDCNNGIKSVASDSVDLIYTDPPYGIFINEVKGSGEFKGDIYKNDTPTEWMSTWELLAPELFRVAKPNSWAMVWISWDMYPKLVGLMTAAGWKVEPLPYVWARQGCGYQSLNPSKHLASSVEWAFIFSKGEPLLARQGLPNHSIDRVLPDMLKTHPLERPLPLCVENITTFVSAGATVLDCFAGGASTGKACLGIGIKPIMFEKDKNYYDRARMELINILIGRVKQEAPEEYN